MQMSLRGLSLTKRYILPKLTTTKNKQIVSKHSLTLEISDKFFLFAGDISRKSKCAFNLTLYIHT